MGNLKDFAQRAPFASKLWVYDPKMTLGDLELLVRQTFGGGKQIPTSVDMSSFLTAYNLAGREAELQKLNPGIDWNSLEGQSVNIPVYNWTPFEIASDVNFSIDTTTKTISYSFTVHQAFKMVAFKKAFSPTGLAAQSTEVTRIDGSANRFTGELTISDCVYFPAYAPGYSINLYACKSDGGVCDYRNGVEFNILLHLYGYYDVCNALKFTKRSLVRRRRLD